LYTLLGQKQTENGYHNTQNQLSMFSFTALPPEGYTTQMHLRYSPVFGSEANV